jgi:putative flippase GtrA
MMPFAYPPGRPPHREMTPTEPSSPDAALSGADKHRSWVDRALRFGRSALVGVAATLVDLAVLELLSRVFHVDPTHAKIPAFLVALLVQFIGNRSFTFKAIGGSLRRQITLFGLVESVTLFLHWLLFRISVVTFHLPIEAANFLVSFVVYVGFSYPAWRIVFRTKEAPGAGA